MAIVAASPARGQCSPAYLAKLLASDAAALDSFGYSVAVSGDTAVVGAYNDGNTGAGDNNIGPGSAYVFVRTGGVWTQQAKLTAGFDAAAGDKFGFSVAVSGDTAVVGAYLDTHAGGAYAGSAYVFVRTGGVWTQQAKLTAPDAEVTDHFGFSVAVSDDTAVVGVPDDDHHPNPPGIDQGSAYVFIRTAGVWTLQAKLIASDTTSQDYFGYSVAVSGDTAVVGAYRDDHTVGIDQGSAYVFVRFVAVWTEQQKLTASDAATGDQFGFSVAVSGNIAVVGANFGDQAGGDNAGAAYVFGRTGLVWTLQAKLTASDAAASDQFGVSVAVSGDTAVVGTPGDLHTGFVRAGSAYVFFRTGLVWTQQAKLTAFDAAPNDFFGTSVALSGDTAVAGAWGDNNAGGADAGSAYIFDLQCAPVCCTGDFDANNIVTNADVPDFVVALLAGGACPAPPACCPGDFNADGMVDGADLPGFLAKLFSGGACP